MSTTNFAPPPDYLFAAAANNLGYAKALAELIDNAIDQNARLINIYEGPIENGKPTWFAIIDDGDGCPEPVIITTFGRRGDATNGGLGRYGVGGPEAIMDIGGLEATVRIESVFKGVIRYVRLSWQELIKTRDGPHPWQLEKATWEGGPSDKKGTSIHIRPVRRRPIPKSVLTQLGYWFGPFIRSGGRIAFHKGEQEILLERWQLPDLEEVIDEAITVDGKSIRIKAGVVREGVRNERAGITIAHRHRVIEEASGSCCGDYGYQRIAGIVMLDRGWMLNKNKDGINEGAAELYAAVYELIEPILQKARQQHQVIEGEVLTELLENEVNRRFYGIERSATDDAKARRHKGDTEGTVTPEGTGRRHRQAAKEQPGTTFPGRHATRAATRKSIGVKIQLGDFPDEDARPGNYDPSGYVTLNRAHRCVKEDWEKRNIDGLIRIVAAIIASDQVWATGTTKSFSFAQKDGPELERFLDLYGRLLSNTWLTES